MAMLIKRLTGLIAAVGMFVVFSMGVISAGESTVMEKVLALAGTNRQSLASALESVPATQREGLVFLLENMQERDLKSIPGERLLEELKYAYEAWEKAPWGKTIPKEMFFNDILAFCVIDESRDPWRKMLFEKFSESAWKYKTPGEAAVMLNSEVFKVFGVKYNGRTRPRPNQSPDETIKAGVASCTGLSILIIDACRACGIPARMAGIMSWKDGKGDANGNHGGNHSWAEVWNSGWHYLGAAEPGELDKTWFTGKTGGEAIDASAREHSIFATSFRKTGAMFPLAWAPSGNGVWAVDVTSRYKPGEEKR